VSKLTDQLIAVYDINPAKKYS